MSRTVKRPLPSGKGTPANSRVRLSARSIRPPFSFLSSVAVRMISPMACTCSGRARFGSIAASKSSTDGCESSRSGSSPHVPPKLRFHNCSDPSGANTAIASNRLSRVAVRVRSRVSRVAERASCSDWSSAMRTSPPSGIGCPIIRKCSPLPRVQNSSCVSRRLNQFRCSCRQAGKSRTPGVLPLSCASARKRSKGKRSAKALPLKSSKR